MVPAEVFTSGFDFFATESRAVDTSGVAFVGGTVADGGGDFDEGGFVGDFLASAILLDTIEVGVAVFDVNHVPAVSFKAFGDIFGEGDIRGPINGDVVIVVEGDEFA